MTNSLENEQQNQINQPPTVFDNQGILKYLLYTLLLSAVLIAVFFYLVREQAFFGSYLEYMTRQVSMLLSLFGEQHDILRSDDHFKTLIAGRFDSMVWLNLDASGTVTTLILVAAIICWPGSTLKKIAVCIVCYLLMYCLNVVRIVLMLMAAVYHPLNAEIFGNFIFPLLYILSGFIYFLIWTKISGRHPMDS